MLPRRIESYEMFDYYINSFRIFDQPSLTPYRLFVKTFVIVKFTISRSPPNVIVMRLQIHF